MVIDHSFLNQQAVSLRPSIELEVGVGLFPLPHLESLLHGAVLVGLLLELTEFDFVRLLVLEVLPDVRDDLPRLIDQVPLTEDLMRSVIGDAKGGIIQLFLKGLDRQLGGIVLSLTDVSQAALGEFPERVHPVAFPRVSV